MRSLSLSGSPKSARVAPDDGRLRGEQQRGEMAMTEGIGARSAAGATGYRWVVLFTGSGAAEDYQPAASAGEPPALIREITDLCLAFHPLAEIRLFPHETGATLFWRAKTTGDAIVTRVATAPNPEGVRTALEYCSAVLSDDDLRGFSNDPFAAADDLTPRIREQFLGGRTDRVPVRAGDAIQKTANGVAPAASGRPPAVPGLSADRLATAENYAALRAFCARGDTAPPSFATWWSSSASAPDRFEILLRAAPTHSLTLKEASEALARLAADLKAALPDIPAGDAVSIQLARGIVTSADSAGRTVAEAASRLHTEIPEQFRDHLTEAARLATQIATDIGALRGRLEGDVPASVGASLAAIAACCLELSHDLPRVRHPNPFGRRTAASAPAATASGAPSAPSGGQSRPLAAAAAVAVLFIGWLVVSHRGSAPARPESPDTHGAGPTTAVPQTAVVVPSAPKPVAKAKPVDPTIALMQRTQAVVLASARKRAHDDARDAAADPAGSGVGEGEVEKITLASIKSGYRDSLPADRFTSAFGPGRPEWTYARLTRVLAILTPAVHEAAMVGAVEGKASRSIASARKAMSDQQTAAPSPTPAPERHKRVAEPTAQEPTVPTAHHAAAAVAPRPAPRPTRSGEPKAGSAAQTGL
jgi:hypothetical protein